MIFPSKILSNRIPEQKNGVSFSSRVKCRTLFGQGVRQKRRREWKLTDQLVDEDGGFSVVVRFQEIGLLSIICDLRYFAEASSGNVAGVQRAAERMIQGENGFSLNQRLRGTVFFQDNQARIAEDGAFIFNICQMQNQNPAVLFQRSASKMIRDKDGFTMILITNRNSFNVKFLLLRQLRLLVILCVDLAY